MKYYFLTDIQTSNCLTHKGGSPSQIFGLPWHCRSCTYSVANSEQIPQSSMLYNYSEQSRWPNSIGQYRFGISVCFLIELVNRQLVVETTFTRGHQEHTHSVKAHKSLQRFAELINHLWGGTNKRIVTQWHIYRYIYTYTDNKKFEHIHSMAATGTTSTTRIKPSIKMQLN